MDTEKSLLADVYMWSSTWRMCPARATSSLLCWNACQGTRVQMLPPAICFLVMVKTGEAETFAVDFSVLVRQSGRLQSLPTLGTAEAALVPGLGGMKRRESQN